MMLHIITKHLIQHEEEMLGRAKQHVPGARIWHPLVIIKLAFIIESMTTEFGGVQSKQ